MPLEIDHLVVAAETLPEGEAMLTDLFRAPPMPGPRPIRAGSVSTIFAGRPGWSPGPAAPSP